MYTHLGKRLSFYIPDDSTDLWRKAKKKYEKENGEKPSKKIELFLEALTFYINANSKGIERAKVIRSIEKIRKDINEESHVFDVLGQFKKVFKEGENA